MYYIYIERDLYREIYIYRDLIVITIYMIVYVLHCYILYCIIILDHIYVLFGIIFMKKRVQYKEG